ncbi:MAG: GNAT family N-acetyltransferase [Lachnospiraceae bacterium]|nr:GNAT family N-acetyltransferase [Lachnospiraceae bacterium]
MKTLETDRLILRDWVLKDIGCGVYDENGIRYLMSVRNNYAIVLKENGLVIGSIGLNEDADNNPDARNVGITLLEQYHNRGIMSEALKCVIQNVSDITKKLSWGCTAEDKRSQHIAEKFGFRYVKTLGNVQGNVSNEPVDVYYYILEL